MSETNRNQGGVKIEVHLIQNFAPSNLNRDDTGQPKSATFGGYRRARISSQCMKRSTRNLWRQKAVVPVGYRTKLMQNKLIERLASSGRAEEDSKKAVDAFLKQFYSDMDGDKTKVLLFVSQQELDVCLDAIQSNWDTLTEGKFFEKAVESKVKKLIMQAEVSTDIALFGRMLAEQPGRNIDGACQVAHPISTHKVDMEMDFYTAVDDLNPKEETGAGMMGIVGFNSACYYRYAVVDRDQLARNLARKTDRANGAWMQALTDQDYVEADKVIEAFLEAMVYAIPTGKQNSFAAQNLPSFGLFVRRQGSCPVSLANAFAKPVRPTKNDDDVIGLSIKALTKHWDELQKVYGDLGAQARACFHLGYEDCLGILADSDKGTVQEAISAVVNTQ